MASLKLMILIKCKTSDLDEHLECSIKSYMNGILDIYYCIGAHSTMLVKLRLNQLGYLGHIRNLITIPPISCTHSYEMVN